MFHPKLHMNGIHGEEVLMNLPRFYSNNKK